MHSRTAILFGATLLLAGLWMTGCGGDGSQSSQAPAGKDTPARRLLPDVEPLPPSPEAKGSLEPGAADTTTPAPETTTPAPETTTPAPDTTTPAPETTTPAPETTTPEPETTTPEPETTTPEPETTTPEPETTAPEPDPDA